MKKRIVAFISACLMGVTLITNTAFGADAFTKVNGQYIDTEGLEIQGALTRGVSVSKYQGKIDWKKAAADDISFAMVRMGYIDSLDPTFDENVKNAVSNGIKVGVYLYSQALTVEKAIEEAKFAVRIAKDYELAYPIAMDVESNYISGLSKQELTDIINAFCKVVSDAGYRPMVYAYNDWLVNKMDTNQIPYDIWYARYGSINNYTNRTIWQCSDAGRVDGITEPVCLELAFTDYSTLIPSGGWRFIDNTWYYFLGYKKQNGWINDNNSWYYMNLDGTMFTGWLQHNNLWYYLNSGNGAMAVNTTQMIDGTNYTFDTNGVWVN